MGRKKRNDSGNAANLFDELPEDLKMDILCRVMKSKKHVAELSCVSKRWFRFITAFCFPNITPTRLPFLGFLFHCQTLSTHVTLACCNRENQRLELNSSIPYLDVKTFPFTTSFATLLDCCNGLLLFGHYLVSNPQIWYYYVLNLFTNQYARIKADSNSITRGDRFCKFGALAYDPSKSSFFKIVRITERRRLKFLDVYNSEDRTQEALKFRLQDHVFESEWIKQFVFFQGAMHTVSMSGHLLRFEVDRQVRVKDQAQAINLPYKIVDKIKCMERTCLGLSNDQLNLMSFDDESCLCVWVLSRTYEWSLKCRLKKIYEAFNLENTFCRFLGFDPYKDIVFLALRTSGQLCSTYLWIDFGKGNLNGEECFYACHGDSHQINWSLARTFPFFHCSVPFAAGLYRYRTVKCF